MKKLQLKNLVRFAIVLFISFGVLSCSKDSDDDNDPKPIEAAGVEGSWNITAINVSPALNGITDLLAFINALTGNDCMSKITFIFKANGVIDGTVPAGCTNVAEDNDIIDDKSTWKVVGNKIQLTAGTEVSEYDLEVNKTEMKWSYDETEDGVTSKYTLVFKRK